MQKSIQHGLGRHIQTLTSAEIRQSSKVSRARPFSQQTLLSPCPNHLHSQFYYAAQLIHIVILSLSKLSTTLLLRTLTPSKGIRQSCTITVGLIGAWTAFAFFGIAFQCPLPEPWLYTPERCTGAMLYPISTFHILTELIILAIPFVMMRNVQITPVRRMKILCSFSARITHVSPSIDSYLAN